MSKLSISSKEIRKIIFRSYYEKELIHEFVLNNGKLRVDIAGVYKNKSYGYEIKVSKQDLKNDNKMFDYLNYFNYCYLVVPLLLGDLAKEKIQYSKYGLIIINKNKPVVIKRAKINKNPLLTIEEVKESVYKGAFYRYKNHICGFNVLK